MSRIRSLFALVLLATPLASLGDEPKAGPLLIEQPRADYVARRRELMKTLKASDTNRNQPGETIVLLRGEDDQGKEDFEEGRFRQHNNFAYLTGVEAPGAWLLLTPSQDRATLYLPPRAGYSRMNGENTKPGSGSETAEALGFDAVEPTSKLLGDLFTMLADPMRRGSGGGSSVIFTLTPNPTATDTRPASTFVKFLKEGAPNTSFRDIAPMLGEMRKIKTLTEIAILQKAIDITGDAQEEVMKAIRPEIFEYQLEGKLFGAFLNGGALRAGFASIVGSGPNATIPHYFANDRKIEDGDMVVVDIGAEYKMYTADITRTYPANGKFSPRQREIYQLVLDAQTAAFEHTKLNKTTMGELNGFVREYLRKSPLRAKDTDGKEYTMDHFFIHGLGHYLGMDVHDVGDYAKPMQVGEVFTIEPGLYIRPENIGVRIEDDYLMTETGPIKMSKNITSDVDEIEKKIAAGRVKSH